LSAPAAVQNEMPDLEKLSTEKKHAAQADAVADTDSERDNLVLPDIACAWSRPQAADESPVDGAESPTRSESLSQSLTKQLSSPSPSPEKRGAKMRRSTTLPSIKRDVLDAQKSTSVGRSGKSVAAWRSRNSLKVDAGCVVKTTSDLVVGSTALHEGQVGRVLRVEEDGSVEVMWLDNNGAEADACKTSLSKKDANSLELQIVSHKVQMVNGRGRPMGSFLRCSLLHDHGDGFLDILCQDGQVGKHIHSGMVDQLPEAEFTHIGYSESALPSAHARTVQDDIALRLEQLSDAQYGLQGVDRCELPPAGYVREGQNKSHFAFSLQAAKTAKGKLATSPQDQEFSPNTTADGFASDSATSPAKPAGPSRSSEDRVRRRRSARDTGEDEEDAAESVPWKIAQTMLQPGEPGYVSRICPFMEIKDGGLRDLVAACSFLTAEDCVIDIGCGTGNILKKILASYPCRGIGIEVNPSIARQAEKALQRYATRSKVISDDIRNVDISEATCVTMYFLTHSFHFIKDYLERNLRHGCVLLNYTYPVPGWKEAPGPPIGGVHKYIIGQHTAAAIAASELASADA